MKAAFITGPQQIELREIPDPAVPEDGLLLRVEACGVCGSDLRRWKEGPIPGAAAVIPGHEAAGVVDYGIGPVAPGVFVIVTTPHPRLREALILRDMGHGPYYTLFRPYHLCSIEVPLTCAMLAIRGKSNMVPLNRLVSEVFAVAKRDLPPGEVLDGIGGSTFYGLIDRFETARQERLLPIGLAKGAKLIRPVSKDTPISYDDAVLQEPSAVLDLRRLQDAWMAGEIAESELLARIGRIESE